LQVQAFKGQDRVWEKGMCAKRCQDGRSHGEKKALESGLKCRRVLEFSEGLEAAVRWSPSYGGKQEAIPERYEHEVGLKGVKV